MRGAVVVRNRSAGIVAIAGLILTLVSAIALLGQGDAAWLAEYPFMLFMVAMAAHLGWWRVTEKPAELVADERGVLVDGKLVRERASLARATILPRAHRSTLVELRRAIDPYPLRITLPSVPDAQAFVRSLGLDARSGMTMTTSSGTNVVIGGDGIAFRTPLRRDRFVPYADIIDIARLAPPVGKTVSRGFVIRTRSGEEMVSTIGDRLRDGAFDTDHFFEAAVAARAAALRHGPSAVRVALLRGGRDVASWLSDLRAAELASYRASAMSEDDLFALLDDPKAADELRAAAAARLAKINSPRLRVAAEGIAAPKVRIAVDAALSGDDDALAKVLEEIS